MPGQFGLRGGQGAVKVGGGLPLALYQAAVYLVGQHVPTPPVLDGSLGVPLALGSVLKTLQQDDVVSPGNLGNKLLHHWLIRPGGGELLHVLQVAGAEAFHLRELGL